MAREAAVVRGRGSLTGVLRTQAGLTFRSSDTGALSRPLTSYAETKIKMEDMTFHCTKMKQRYKDCHLMLVMSFKAKV